MRKSVFLLLFLLWGVLLSTAVAQNREFPNAVHAKLNFFDYGSLNDEDFKLGEGFEVGYFRNIAPFLNVGVPFKLGVAKLPGTSGNTVTTSLDLVFHLENIRNGAKVSPYAFAGGGYFMEEFENGHLQFPFGAGVNFRISEFAFINVQGEYRKSVEDMRDNVQLGVGFIYLLHKAPPKEVPPADRDRDGVPDISDNCPDQPGAAATAGCPDRDADGVADKDDLCPDEAGVATTNGCPDQDEDGVADKDDLCPTEAGTLDGCPDTDRDGVADKDDDCPDEAGTVKGCPDSDYDGIANKDDKCPQDPGPESNGGCPLVKDSDRDGVADDVDPCPDAAGPFNGCPDTDEDGVADNLDKCPNTAGPATNFGCPEVKEETKERLEFVTRNIQFETGMADLKIASFKILDELEEIMKQYPDYKLAINGHTDDVGHRADNLKLSAERAKTCFDYLVYRGIAENRMRSKGYGESRPIASNKSSRGREKNRRVEFKLVLDYDER
ncbi:MAG: OmpA family protein [Bacteroidetes bacterium]|nr:MAG: OmpA family protein [Bacteroidota bacterium]